MIRDLSPLLCRGLLLAAVVVFVCNSPVFFVPDPFPKPLFFGVSCVWTAVLFLIAVIAWASRSRWLWPFASRTRLFLTASGDRIVLRYAPQLRGAINPEEVLGQAENALAELEARFGRLTLFWHGRHVGPLLFRRRVYVYVFPTPEAVQEVFGKGYAAIALTALHAVVVPFHQPILGESLRHELTHLFAYRWNPWAPSLFCEGLPTWLQGTAHGYSIDSRANLLLRREDHRLRPLLDEKFFREGNCWPHYVLAGSFTGFLIRRFGWDAYKRFYCGLQGDSRFDRRFARRFGLTLEEAEGQWRQELLEKYYAPVRRR
jgi:hypothetical protein